MHRSIARAILLVSFFGAAFAASAAQRTFVSTSGSDSNTATNCAKTAPCRGFAAALTVTDAGGEIIVLDSGGYGAVSISQSVAIIAPEGVYAGISVFSGNGVTIASLGVHVVLRGLTINGLGGDYGIAMTSGASLSVEHCVVANFDSSNRAGLYVYAAGEVSVTHSLFRGNRDGAHIGGGATARISDSQFLRNTSIGVLVDSTSSGTTQVSVERTVSSGNGMTGFYTGASAGSAHMAITEALASENADYGVEAQSAGGSSVVSVSSSLISHNGDMGVYAYGSSTSMLISDNTITRNDFGLYQAGSAVFRSTGDNRISENATAASSGTITSLTTM